MKMQSRKLWAWIVWSMLIAYALIKNQFTPELIQWYGLVSVIYIGGQSAVDIYKIKAEK